MSHIAAHITNDLGIILGTIGATAITRTVTAAASNLRFPAAFKELQGTKFELNRFHQAARNLSEIGQNNIRILRGWAKSKGWTKAPNFGEPEKWGTLQNGKFRWNLSIKSEASFRPNLHVDSNCLHS